MSDEGGLPAPRIKISSDPESSRTLFELVDDALGQAISDMMAERGVYQLQGNVTLAYVLANGVANMSQEKTRDEMMQFLSDLVGMLIPTAISVHSMLNGDGADDELKKALLGEDDDVTQPVNYGSSSIN